MKRNIGLFSVMLLVCASCILFASGSQEKTAGRIKLSYWTQAVRAEDLMTKAFVAKHPSIEIEQVDTGGQLTKVVPPALTSGEGIDIVYYELGLGHVAPLIQAGLLIDLEAPAKRFGWKEKLTKFATAEATHFGKLWAVPNETELIVMFYNRKILKELGIAEPASDWLSWEDLITLCEKAKSNGLEPIALGAANRTRALHRISLGFQWGSGGAEEVGKALFERASWATPGLVSGIETIRMLDSKYIPGILERTSTEAEAVFHQGAAPLIHEGTFIIKRLVKAMEESAKYNLEDIGMFLPAKPGSKTPESVAGCGGGWYVAAATKNLEACLKFLDFTISDESQRIWVQNGLMPPTRFDTKSVAEAPEVLSRAVELINRYPMGYFIHHFVSPDSRRYIEDGYQSMVAGKITHVDFAKEFDRLAQKAWAEGFEP